MKIRCPNCGAVASLDLLLSTNEANKAVLAAFDLPPVLKQPVIKYLGLFRSVGRELSASRWAKLLSELTPHINSGQLQFDKRTTAAPIEAWDWAINEMLERDARQLLARPLGNHHYLFRVVQAYKPKDKAVSEADTNTRNGDSTPILTAKQINYFANLLANDTQFGMEHADTGEDLKAFTQRVRGQLRDVKKQHEWLADLKRVGYDTTNK